MNKKYHVIISRRADNMILQHIEFLSRVSLPAAKKLRNDFISITNRLTDNPFQFPLETDLILPTEGYRKAIFFKRYKVLFLVEDDSVYIDAIVDCRSDNSYLAYYDRED